MKNRFPVTIRFNQNEQRDLQALMDFYQIQDPKRLLLLAYSQFKLATKELNNKLQAAKQGEGNEVSTDNGVVSSADATDPGSSEVVHGDSGRGDGSVPAAGADAAG